MNFLRAAIVALLSVNLGGCSLVSVFYSAKASRSQADTYLFPMGERVKLTGFNGRIEVKAGAPGEVRIARTVTCRASTIGEAAAGLEMIVPSVTQEGGLLAVEFVRPTSKRHEFHVTLSATVPPDTQLDLRGDNGSLDVEGVRGAIDARTTNGAVRARDGGASAVYVHTSNGEIHLERFEGPIQAYTSNGRVVARECSGHIAIETSNGEVEIGAAPVATAGIVARSSNGAIRCLLPASFSGEIDAHTSNGRVRCDFGVDGSQRRSTHKLQGRIGQGGTLVKLNTGNGSIDILGCDLPFEHRQKTKAAPAAAGDEVWKL